MLPTGYVSATVTWESNIKRRHERNKDHVTQIVCPRNNKTHCGCYFIYRHRRQNSIFEHIEYMTGFTFLYSTKLLHLHIAHIYCFRCAIINSSFVYYTYLYIYICCFIRLCHIALTPSTMSPMKYELAFSAVRVRTYAIVVHQIHRLVLYDYICYML